MSYRIVELRHWQSVWRTVGRSEAMRVTDVGMDTIGFVVRLLEFCAMRCVVSTRYRHSTGRLRASESSESRFRCFSHRSGYMYTYNTMLKELYWFTVRLKLAYWSVCKDVSKLNSISYFPWVFTGYNNSVHKNPALLPLWSNHDRSTSYIDLMIVSIHNRYIVRWIAA